MSFYGKYTGALTFEIFGRSASLASLLLEERELLTSCRIENVKLQLQLLQAPQTFARSCLASAWKLWCEELERGTVRRRCALRATRRCVHRFHVLRRAAWAAWAACVIRCRVLRRCLVRLVLSLSPLPYTYMCNIHMQHT